MLVPEARGQPHDGYRLQAGSVCQQLSQVIVIGQFKLVFDQHRAVCTDVLANDVGVKRTDFLFLCFQFEFKAERFGEDFKMLRSGEPRREMRGLARPDGSQVDAFKTSKRILVNHGEGPSCAGGSF